MTRSDMSTITVKIGGSLAGKKDSMRELVGDLALLQRSRECVLVHGGGAEVTTLSKTLGCLPLFENGLRITSVQEMDIVEMVLSGRINKRLVRMLSSAGINAVGVSGADGGLFRGKSISAEHGSSTRTGTITGVRPALLELLLARDYFPVVSSTSMDDTGEGLNINADEAALEIAVSLQSESLIFLSDIPGIVIGGKVLSFLNEEEALRAIQEESISGGMIPKVKASLSALHRGVGEIVIGEYGGTGSLELLLSGKLGTIIKLN